MQRWRHVPECSDGGEVRGEHDTGQITAEVRGEHDTGQITAGWKLCVGTGWERPI